MDPKGKPAQGHAHGGGRPQNFPRELAARIVGRVLTEHENLDLATATILAQAGPLTPEHRAWLLEVSSGVLRWKSRIELAIDSAAIKKKPTGWLRRMLLVAGYQLIAQDRVHPGAVVNEMVSDIKRKEGDAPGRFANAVLRKVGDHAAEWRALPFPAQGDPARQAQWAGMPEWLWRKLVIAYGPEWVAEFARASLERPVVWVRALTPDFVPPTGAEAGPVPGAFRMPASGAISQWKGFDEGAFFVQDLSSQRLVHEIAAAVTVGCAPGAPAPTALDLCAAPGGKAMGLAASGVRVTATDLDPGRLRLVEENLRRVKLAEGQVRVIARDDVAGLEAQDLVWVDAPCSGSGIIRRHPDIKWLRQEAEIVSLANAQRKLIQEAWTKVKSGGWLAYSVCSVLAEEGLAHFRDFPGVRLQEWLLEPQVAPYGDGFWAILIKKA